MISLTGCYSVQSPNILNPNAPDQIEVQGKVNLNQEVSKIKEEISPAVITLLGIGGGLIFAGSIAATYDGLGDYDEIALAAGGVGLLFWGAAGIVHLAE